MRRQVWQHYGTEPAQPSGLRKSKLDPNGKCGVAVKQPQQQQPQQQKQQQQQQQQQPQQQKQQQKQQQPKQKQASEQPVDAKTNPLQFLERKSNAELVVHWTRAESSQFPPIKLLPPW